MVLPAPVGPTSATGPTGRRFQIDAENALVAVLELECHVLVAHVAGDLGERPGVGLLAYAVGGVEHLEKAPERRRVLEDAHGESGQQVELADQQAGEADEGNDLADRDLLARDKHGADRIDGDHRDGGGDAGEHRQQPPPGEDGVLSRQQLGHDGAHGLHLGGEARIALHHRDVAEHVADPPVDVVVIALDGGLVGAGAARHVHVGEHVHHRQRRQDQRHLGVHVDSGRHQHQQAHERDELLAQEGQPVPEQRVGAGQDGAHYRARPLLGVIADRQDDGVLERLPQCRQAPAMREPVGRHRHDHAGDDADQAQHRPQSDDREGSLSERQGVDHPRQQHLLGDRHDAERDAGQHDQQGLPPLDHEHRHGTLVEAPDRHVRLSSLQRHCCGPPRQLGTYDRAADAIPLPLMGRG